MTQSRTFYIVRHGETDWNKLYRWQGQTDIPLNEDGREQARRLSGVMAGLPIDRVVASDLSRAWETARLVSAPHGLEIETDPLWREMYFGSIEGVTWNDLKTQHPQVVAGMDSDWYGFVFPGGGESRGMLQQRALTAFRRLLDDGYGQHVLVVSHGTAIRVLLGGLFAAELGDAPQLPILNTSLTVIRATGSRLELVQPPSAAHLD